MHHHQKYRHPKKGKAFAVFSLSILFTLSTAFFSHQKAGAFSLNQIQYVRLQGTTPVFALSGNTLYHVPNAAQFAAMGGSWSAVKSVSSVSGDHLGLPMVVPYPSGSLVKASGQPTIYLVVHGILRPIASANIFNQMGLSWSAVQIVSNVMNNWAVGAPISTPKTYWPSGTVLRQSGQPQVYEVENGVLSHITSAAQLYSLGYQWSNVHIVTTLPYPAGTATAAVHAYPTGSLLKVPGNPAIYVNEEGTLRHIPSAALFHDLGFHFSHILSVSSLNGNTMGPALGSAAIPNDPSQPSSSPSPDPTTTVNGFMSMGYGYYADNEPNGAANSSYLDLLQHGNALSVINPVWYYVKPQSGGGWTLNDWTTSIPTINGQTNVQVVTQAAHKEGVLVMPSVGIYYNPSSGPITTASDQQALVQQLVNIAQKNGYDGLTIDFESQGSGNMSVTQASNQYTQFIQSLGQALHAIGKKLMIAVYASPYPSTIYNYKALAPYVNWINVMAYPQHNSSTPPGPTQGFPWLSSIVQNALSTGVNPSQIILGVAPYGHSWTFTNSGSQGNNFVSNRGIQNYITAHQITPVWDPREKSIVFTTGPLAQTPPATLSYNVNKSSPQVANLQAILNIVLLQYAVDHNQTPPSLLWAAGYYGSVTSQAVTLFQQEFKVANAQPGVYDQATAQALSQAISKYSVGQTQWWDQTSRSFGDLLKLATQDHLAGVASWRLPFETSGYWNTLTSMASIWKQ